MSTVIVECNFMCMIDIMIDVQMYDRCPEAFPQAGFEAERHNTEMMKKNGSWTGFLLHYLLYCVLLKLGKTLSVEQITAYRGNRDGISILSAK